MFGEKSVSIHEEATGAGSSFAQQGGLIAWHNLAICVEPLVVQFVPIFHEGGSTKTPGGQKKQICGLYGTKLWSYISDGPNYAT